VTFASSLSSLPNGSLLVLMQPTVAYGSGDVKDVRTFLENGGTVLVADKSGLANSLLSGMGAGVSIESGLSVEDSLYNWRAKAVPTALIVPGTQSAFPFVANVTGLALNLPSPLLLSVGARVLGETSLLSFAVNSSLAARQSLLGTTPPQLAKGPFAVAAAEKIGRGTLVVVGDSQLLQNSQWSVADNSRLISNLFSRKKVIVDSTHWAVSPLTSGVALLKGEIGTSYAVLSTTPDRYAVAAGILVLAALLVPTSGSGEGARKSGILNSRTNEHLRREEGADG